jgi:20S proteasome alpha/beta subunit
MQYDLSATTFSPDGRVFQTEYATKAVDNSGWISLEVDKELLFDSVACAGLR